MLRTASAILTSARRTTPAAAVRRPSPSDAASCSSIARAAAAVSSGMAPPRKLRAARGVADRTGFGAGALRSERQRAARIDPRDGAATGAHLLDVDHGNAER